MAIELHFYPGQNMLAVLDVSKNGTFVLKRVEAMGGPGTQINNGGMSANPTTPGDFIIDRIEAYRTPTWIYSSIKWGTPILDKPDINGIKYKDDVWYKTSSGKWASLKNDYKITRSDILKMHIYLYGESKVPDKWIFNDFGPVAIRWFKDKNKNGKLDDGEELSGEMFHTTPDNEAQTALNMNVVLVPSHGCIHLKPTDRDNLLTIGAFKSGTKFKVYKYQEVFQK
jgi:hypothetical protein